jgi:endonuclease/exonuclease/phosphatase family metal-dependent hydrolase
VGVVAELAASLVAHATAHAGPDGITFPPVVTGDFNAEPDSDEVRRLSGLATAPAADGLVLMDAWRFAEHGDPGWTWRRENAYLVEGNPDARIDHVLVGLGTGHGLGAVRSVGLVGAAAVDGVWPSDHAGIRVDLAATPRAGG